MQTDHGNYPNANLQILCLICANNMTLGKRVKVKNQRQIYIQRHQKVFAHFFSHCFV